MLFERCITLKIRLPADMTGHLCCSSLPGVFEQVLRAAHQWLRAHPVHQCLQHVSHPALSYGAEVLSCKPGKMNSTIDIVIAALQHLLLRAGVLAVRLGAPLALYLAPLCITLGCCRPCLPGVRCCGIFMGFAS